MLHASIQTRASGRRDWMMMMITGGEEDSGTRQLILAII